MVQYDMQIRDETQTKIDLPAEGEKSDVITITGKKENVEEARDRIQKIQNELVSSVYKLIGYTGCSYLYRPNWANNNGEAELTMDIRYSDASVLLPIKMQVFISFYVHQPNNHFENISVFLFACLQLSSHKNCF